MHLDLFLTEWLESKKTSENVGQSKRFAASAWLNIPAVEVHCELAVSLTGRGAFRKERDMGVSANEHTNGQTHSKF